MKNVSIGLLIMAALIAGYFIGKSSSNGQEPVEKENKEYFMADNFIMDAEEVVRLRDIYVKHGKRVNGGRPDSTVTNFITFDRSSFEAMGSFFRDSTNNDVAGVRCFMIRYDKKYIKANGQPQSAFEIKGKKYEEQNSIVFLPVDRAGRTLYNRWTKYTNKSIAGFNHGELCPENCYNEIP